MKRLLCAAVAFAVLACAFCAVAEELTDTQRFADLVSEFELYMEAGVEDYNELIRIQGGFYSISSAYGNLLGAYCNALSCAADGRYSLAIGYAELIAANDLFNNELLPQIESPHIAGGRALLTYVSARGAQAEGDAESAFDSYLLCPDYFDTPARINALEPSVCELKYNRGVSAYQSGDYNTAYECFLFTSGYNYKDSADWLKFADIELKATPAPTKKPTPTPKPSYKQARANMSARQKLQSCVSAGTYHTVCLKTGGTALAAGWNIDEQCSVSKWSGIVAVAAGSYHTVGLKSNGAVVAVGSNNNNQCNVSKWRDIVAVAAGTLHTVGLRADGTVVAVGSNYFKQCDVSAWRDIVAVAAGSYHTVGLKADGTLVAAGRNDEKQLNVGAWRGITAIAAGGYHTIGIKSNGTVVAIGDNEYNQCDVGAWRNIVAVAGGNLHTVGLKSDGKPVAAGSNYYNQCHISAWSDIVAVAAGDNHTLGLTSDGYVVAIGHNWYTQCNVSKFSGVGVAD